jgi:hypothetical protein
MEKLVDFQWTTRCYVLEKRIFKIVEYSKRIRILVKCCLDVTTQQKPVATVPHFGDTVSTSVR